ncbi:hypothetical protein D3C85_1763420 [compost metagenome]
MIPNLTAIDGRIAIIARKIAPGKVILEITSSINVDVDKPGLIPGINPPFFFMSSDI